MTGPLVVVGDCLLDRDICGSASRLAPDGPAPVLTEVKEISRPGGAGLAAAMAAADGCEIVLITGISNDEAGHELRGLVAGSGMKLVDLGLNGPTPEKIRVLAGGHLLARIDRGCEETARPGVWSAEASDAMASAGAVLVADYGRGVTSDPEFRSELASLTARVPVVWDPHPKGARPVEGVRLATPNAAEARHFAPISVHDDSLNAHTARARELCGIWRAANVAVTLSKRGALLVTGDAPCMVFPADPVSGDPCGAGDRFSSAAAIELQHGSLPSAAVRAAVKSASRFVASGGALSMLNATSGNAAASGTSSAGEVIERVRRTNGVVVVTGGCFDLLHAGHVATLEAARRLGDCLIVALNSDSSIGALKGPERPLVPQEERARLLAALRCVDAVVVFDEPTPERLLEKLKPDIFVKGGDYSPSDLPETAVMERWGGQVVILPYLADHSTSELIRRAAGTND